MRLALLCAFSLALPAFAQLPNLQLDEIAAKAREKVEVNLEGALLDAMRQSLPAEKRDALQNVRAVTVRSYEFDQAGAYSTADLDRVRQLASGSGWAKVVDVKETNESTEIFLLNQGGRIDGVLVIAAEANELTIVYLQGMVQLAQLEEVVESTISFDMAALQKR